MKTHYYITSKGLNYVNFTDVMLYTHCYNSINVTDEDIVKTFEAVLGDDYEVTKYNSELFKLAPGQYKSSQLTLEQRLQLLEWDGYIKRNNMDWHKLYCGHVSPDEVQRAIHNEEWQELRKSLKGKSLEYKYRGLINYLGDKSVLYFHGQMTREEFRMVKVRITNYVTALSRGGLIKPNDYR